MGSYPAVPYSPIKSYIDAYVHSGSTRSSRNGCATLLLLSLNASHNSSFHWNDSKFVAANPHSRALENVTSARCAELPDPSRMNRKTCRRSPRKARGRRNTYEPLREIPNRSRRKEKAIRKILTAFRRKEKAIRHTPTASRRTEKVIRKIPTASRQMAKAIRKILTTSRQMVSGHPNFREAIHFLLAAGESFDSGKTA
jgi:hypothetical protein